MPTWYGIIQEHESGKASENPAVEGCDLVGKDFPMKARYEHGDTRMIRWDVIRAGRSKGVECR